ncbi:MAG: metabolite traffic protein EboE [Chitinophagaceae bacterium]|nr:metabolite traffic protein EboE [Chitinophagaceae bacterium]
MQTQFGHLTYCTNIHAGESWDDHFAQLQKHLPAIKKEIAPDRSMGIGLRLSDEASVDLSKSDNLSTFKQWLKAQHAYVFIMNGFPFGGFHRTVVKDKVHAPDWTTPERERYTSRLAHLLSELLPEGMEGGISTSPLSYRYWHVEKQLPEIFEESTLQLLRVVDQLIQIKQATGKSIHIALEPEPDGLIGDGKEFINWYTDYLIPIGVPYLSRLYGCDKDAAERYIRQHIQLCYDVCHFAVNFEEHAVMISRLKELGIKVGRIQISSALKATFPSAPEDRQATVNAFARFDESVYLHQVVSLQQSGQYKRYRDLPEALADKDKDSAKEWRAHFHVPVFEEDYGKLQSTQSDIRELISIHKHTPFTSHLEVETYTWEVLPEEKKLPLTESITREMQWAKGLLSDL